MIGGALVDGRRGWLSVAGVGAIVGGLNLGHYGLTHYLDGVEARFGVFPGGLPVGAARAALGRGLSPSLVAMAVLGLGIVVGAGIATRISGELTIAKFRARKLEKRRAMLAALGGVLMGTGVLMAHGCLVRHVLTGAPLLSLASMLTVAGIIGGIWVCVLVMARRGR